MPLMQCTIDGRRGWKFGQSGTCHVGPDARRKALRQAAAMRTSGFTGNARRKRRRRRQIVPSNPLKADPTRTLSLRRRFEVELVKRFRVVRRRIIELVDAEDAFGLKRRAELISQLRVNQQFAFLTDSAKIAEFAEWLSTQIDADILAGADGPDGYLAAFIEDGYRRGAGAAFDAVNTAAAVSEEDVGGLAFFEGSREEFLRQAFANPVSREMLDLLVSRTFSDLVGVTEAMAQQIRRVLADGLVTGKHPYEIARDLADRVDGIGIARARLIARTEIIRAHAEGQLDNFQRLGVEDVGLMAEWSTAGDDRVCPACSPLDGVVMTIAEARGIIPRHSGCRCTWVPANVGESGAGQKRSKADIQAAIDRSIRSRARKAEKKLGIDQLRERSTWPGATREIASERPRGVLEPQ